MRNLIMAISSVALVIAMAVPAMADTYASGDTGIMVYGPIGSYASPSDAVWSSPYPAVPTWVHPSWPSLAGATWISTTYLIEGPVPYASSWRKFEETFEVPRYATPTGGAITVTSDNAEEVYINGALVGADGEVQGPYIDNLEWATMLTYTIPQSALQTGTNTLEIIVRNYPRFSSPYDNPTGVIYKMEVNYEVPSVVEVAIDIKPGSYPNAINLGSHGLIPVAILSSDEFDATTVDPESVELGGAGVSVRGKSNKLMAHQEDVDADGLADLVVQVATENLDPGAFQDGYAILTGKTYDDVPIEGVDEITITPAEKQAC